MRPAPPPAAPEAVGPASGQTGDAAVASATESFLIELAPGETDEVRALIGELDGTLSAHYPPEQRHGLAIDAIFAPHVRFFVVRSAGVAVGCAGVALFPDLAEVKRMYVRPAARGRGAARALLARLEAEALDAGFTVLRLETGDRQPEAVRLYELAGFRPCPAFGDYAAMAPARIATSLFYEKNLSGRAS
jgi:putative acetyltransferase